MLSNDYCIDIVLEFWVICRKRNNYYRIWHIIENYSFLCYALVVHTLLTILSLFIYMFVCLFVWWCSAPQYFSCIVAVSFIGGGTGRPGENHWPVTSHWQTLLHNVVHLTLIEIRTHNISGDRYWLHRQLYVSFSLFMPMIFILFFLTFLIYFGN